MIPEVTDNDRFVAYNLLQNAAVAIEGQLPSCQAHWNGNCNGKKGKLYIQESMMRMAF
jgi:fumarate hydratase class I